MKRFVKALTVFSCLCLTLVLAACSSGSSEPKESETLTVADQKSPFYVLVVGNDSRIGTTEIGIGHYADGTGRSDTMMLVRVDPNNYQLTLVTVPRDTTATIDGVDKKINEVYREKGIEALVDEVSTLTGVPIEYYFDMDFVEFEQFINDFEGVHANVPINMSLKDIVTGKNISLSAGPQDLNGAEALVLARTRKAYADDLDACRQIQDRQIVQVGIQKVLDDPATAAASAATLVENADTNWDSGDLAETVVDFVENADKVTFLSGTGPYEGDINPANELWMIPRDEATWKQVMDVVDAGGDPQTVIALPLVSAA